MSGAARYQRLRKLGQGSFGSVYLCRDLNSPSSSASVVMKEIDLSALGKNGRAEALREIGLLRSLQHPYIIAFRDYFEAPASAAFFPAARTPNNLFLVMEYAENGDLSKRIAALAKTPGGSLSESEIISLFTQISLGLKHLHDRKILHRDIKTENIFLSKNGSVRIGDFGISKTLNNTLAAAVTRIGTPYYLPPEICIGRPYNTKADIWSLGVVLYEMLQLRHPFDAPSIDGLLKKIANQRPAPVSSKYSAELRNLVENLLQKDPKKRPTINEILSLPFLQSEITRLLTPEILEKEFSHTIIHKGGRRNSEAFGKLLKAVAEKAGKEEEKMELLSVRSEWEPPTPALKPNVKLPQAVAPPLSAKPKGIPPVTPLPLAQPLSVRDVNVPSARDAGSRLPPAVARALGGGVEQSSPVLKRAIEALHKPASRAVPAAVAFPWRDPERDRLIPPSRAAPPSRSPFLLPLQPPAVATPIARSPRSPRTPRGFPYLRIHAAALPVSSPAHIHSRRELERLAREKELTAIREKYFLERKLMRERFAENVLGAGGDGWPAKQHHVAPLAFPSGGAIAESNRPAWR